MHVAKDFRLSEHLQAFANTSISAELQNLVAILVCLPVSAVAGMRASQQVTMICLVRRKENQRQKSLMMSAQQACNLSAENAHLIH